MEFGPALLAVTVAIVPAVAAFALAAWAVGGARDAGHRCRRFAAELDDRGALIVGRLRELRDLISRSRGVVDRVSARTTALDDGQVRLTARLAAARRRLERMTATGMLPLARWLERLGFLMRIVRLRRNVFG